MRRKLCLKLLLKIPRTKTNSISSQPSFSSFSETKPNPFSETFFRYRHSHSWNSRSINEYSGKTRYGLFFNPVISRRFFSKTLKMCQSKGISRAQFTTRNFHSFDFQRLGWRSWFRHLTTDGVVIGLIITNTAVFILWHIANQRFMRKNFMISVENFVSGRVHTLITSAFSHNDMGHLISNMIGLYFFGMSMGRTLGPEYLLKLYLSGALVGSVFYLVYQAFIAPALQGKQMLGVDPRKISALGASGAVNAIMLLDIFLFPKKTIYLDFIIPIPAVLVGIFLIGKDILRMLQGDDRVSGSAHLGGATVAAIAWARIRKGGFPRF